MKTVRPGAGGRFDDGLWYKCRLAQLGGLRVSEMDADTAFAAAILLGELVVMNMDAGAVMLLVDILNPESESVTDLAADYAELAALNPIRYRGYYYDTETGYYFLNTRYYNPEWRRFLNADALFIAGDDAINGSNMYAYCNGNPVMLSDPRGMGAVRDWLVRAGEKHKWLYGIGDTYNKVQNERSKLRSVVPSVVMVAASQSEFVQDAMNEVGNKLDRIYSNEYWDIAWEEREYLLDGFVHARYIPGFNMDMRVLAGLGAWALDFHKNRNIFSPNYGNYTTLEGSIQWQKMYGYTWYYDLIFSIGGPVTAVKLPFVAENGTTYVVWCWKGEYWNLGAGAEIGLYYQDDPKLANNGYYNIDPENLKVHVLMNVLYNGENITTNFYQTNWWITSFTPRKQKPKRELIAVELKVEFAGTGVHSGLMKPFYEAGEYYGGYGDWARLSWSDTSFKPGRNMSNSCGLHPVRCTCHNKPCQYYSDTEFNVDGDGYQFEIRY